MQGMVLHHYTKLPAPLSFYLGTFIPIVSFVIGYLFWDGNTTLDGDPVVVVSAAIFLGGLSLWGFGIRTILDRKRAVLAEAEGNYNLAMSIVKRHNDVRSLVALRERRDAAHAAAVAASQVHVPVQSPVTGANHSSITIQNIQSDSGTKNVTIQDSVVTDSNLR